MNANSRKQSRETRIDELLIEYKSKMDETKASRQTPLYWHLLYVEEAVKSFNQGYNVSCILTASAFVECILFWEYKRRNPNSAKAGTPLKESGDSLWKFLTFLAKRGVPINDLLFKHENKFDKPSDVKFVETRNLFAHGSILEVVRIPAICYPITDEASDYGIIDEEYYNLHPKSGFENIAYIQLSKALKFAITFTNYLGLTRTI